MNGRVQIDQDVQLMQRFQAGDEDAFEMLLRHYQHKVFGVASRFLLDADKAERATQETFVQVYRVRRRNQPQSEFVSWLFHILNQVATGLLSYPAAQAEGDDPQTWDDEPATGNDRVRRETQWMVKKAIAELAPNERMALILDHWENMPMAKIAEVLGQDVPAAEMILSRARKKMRVKLAAYLE